MITRRAFIQQSAMAGIAFSLPESLAVFRNDDTFGYQSSFFKIHLEKDRPAFTFFSTDSLGGGVLSVNTILGTDLSDENVYESRIGQDSIAYFPKTKGPDKPLWECKASPRSFSLRTQWNENNADALPFTVAFAQKVNHCTVLGIMEEKNVMQFPCVLHFPDMGSFRVYCSEPSVTLFYDADRLVKDRFIKLAFPAADEHHKDITYSFESVAIYPELDIIRNDPRFDGFRRNFINSFQMNPRIYSLANNAASDTCAFALYFYAEAARFTPALVKGITAMDLVRNTLDRFFGGMLGYGQVGYMNVGGGWTSEYDSCDTAPSLIISACNYIQHTNDLEWGRANYNHIRDWTDKMIATDRNKDGFIEYGYSGNSGSWDGVKRPANWWDTIGFGHDDAYSNALAYRACTLLAMVAQRLNEWEDAKRFESFAANLKSRYYNHFYNSETGVLAGWRSEDGQLHDYYFIGINGLAISNGLIEEAEGRQIMQRFVTKMKNVGYTNFRLGLPGNLIKVANEDYSSRRFKSGYDAFQIYINGGATGCHVYHTIHALYKLGMKKEAESILMPMLESYKHGDFQGYCPGSETTKDWKAWDGECWGYEGYLAENFMAVLGVFDYSEAQ
ncbi:MAG: hypothetical protein EAS52_06470 [Parapedobacter sp.]|nr:MAG: hypothetical protein EAS52_06470 [Parapedobacter sp.]